MTKRTKLYTCLLLIPIITPLIAYVIASILTHLVQGHDKDFMFFITLGSIFVSYSAIYAGTHYALFLILIGIFYKKRFFEFFEKYILYIPILFTVFYLFLNTLYIYASVLIYGNARLLNKTFTEFNLYWVLYAQHEFALLVLGFSAAYCLMGYFTVKLIKIDQDK